MNSFDTLLLATQNADKVKEIRQALSDLDIKIVSADQIDTVPDVIEDRPTLEGNAEKKAVELSKATRLFALADDTGLEVDALDGAPGVYSSRYAGPNATYDDNVDKLLQAMRDIPDSDRSARFRTVMVLTDGKEIKRVDGICNGIILTERRGTQGFGYDPIFWVPGYEKTFAEMSIDEKNAISHRGRALAKIHDVIQNLIHPGV
jgi:XTP/dITP diphosphohydrolase